MSTTLILYWAVLVSVLSVLGAYYARRYNRPDALIAFYVTLITFANLAVSKIISFDIGPWHFFAPATVMIFSVTFLLTDVVNEKFGRKETQRMILIAAVSQIAVTAFSYLVLNAKPAPFFQNQAAIQALFGMVPRVVFASFVAFLVSENADAIIFHWFKRLTGDKYLWMRNAFSSMPSMFIDSTLFVTIAFYGVIPIWPLILGQSAIKWFVSIIDIPFMYLSRAIMGGSNKT